MSGKFLIATNERSGSEYLCCLLANYLEWARPFEFIYKEREKLNSTDWDQKWLSDLIINLLADPTVAGIKLHWMQVCELAVKLGVQKFDVLQCIPKDLRVIYLRRDDKLRQAISLYRAHESGRFVYREHEPDNPIIPYSLSKILQLEAYLKFADKQWLEFFETLEITPFEITYESLVQNPRQVVEQLLTHLGHFDLGEINVEVPIKKQSDETTEAWVRKIQSTGSWRFTFARAVSGLRCWFRVLLCRFKLRGLPYLPCKFIAYNFGEDSEVSQRSKLRSLVRI